MTKKQEPFETWVIWNKAIGEYFKATSGKTAWRKPAHAKGAWRRSSDYSDIALPRIFDDSYYGRQPEGRFPKFDEQDTYELIELKPESEDKLAKAEALLKECISYFDQAETETDIFKMNKVYTDLVQYFEEGK